MAVAIDASSNGGAGSGTSETFSHTCSGSDRYLLVGAWKYYESSTITATYAGVSMTKIYEENAAGISIAVFGLAAPSTGANNVVISSTASLTVFHGAAVSFTGAKQTGQPNVYNGQARVNDNTDVGASVTTTVDGCGVVGFGAMDNGTLIAGDANTTLLSSTGTFGVARTTTFPQTTAGAISITFDGAAGSWGQAAVIAIEPAAGAATGPASLKTRDTIAKASVKTIDSIAIASVKTIDTIT